MNLLSENTPIIEDLHQKEEKVTVKEIKNLTLKALVVDDSEINLKVISRLLNKSKNVSFDITLANDGNPALEHVKSSMKPGQSQFDVIFMDNVMIEMNGPAAAREMRNIGMIIDLFYISLIINLIYNPLNLNHKGFKGMIVGVTGNILTEDIEEFLNCGANKILAKPVNLDVLLNSIKELLLQ